MTEGRVILFAGGGTGGHLYPGIAIAQCLRAMDLRIQPVFLCTTREIDRVILEPTGFEFIPQPIVPPVRTIGGLLKFWISWRETRDLVRKFVKQRRPAAAFGLGGYAAGVAIKYAATHRIPAAILNPDVIPGKANLFLMKQAKAVCCQFEQTREHVSADQQRKLQITGCPIRADILSRPPRAEAAARLGLNPSLGTLVITGASLGAQSVNQAILATLPDLNMQGWQVLHLAGREHAAAVSEGYRKIKLNAHVIDFTPAMADVWAVADLAVCRAGASTCAELTACGIPSVLMPYPFHKDMHQRANAKVLADANAACLLEDQKDPEKNRTNLRPVLQSLLHDSAKRRSMAANASSLGRPDAAQRVAGVILSLTA